MPDLNPVTPDAAVARIESLVTDEAKRRADDAKKIQDKLAEQDVRFERLEKKTTTATAAAPVKFSFGPVIRGLSSGRWDGAEKFRDEGIEAIKNRDMSMASAGDGGYVVPAVYTPEVIDILRAQAILHRMGITMISGVRGKTITRTRKTAGTTAAYLAENTALGLTAPTFSQVTVSPHIAGAYTAMSRLVAEQSDPALEGVVRADLSRSAALLQDTTGLFGDGTGSNPTGLFNNADVAVTSAAAAITLDTCLDAITAVEGRNGILDPTKAAFLMHPSLWGTLRKSRSDGGGGAGTGPYLLTSDPTSPTRRSLQGYPVYLSTLCEIVTGGTDSAFTMTFGDFSQLEHIVWNDLGIETTNVGGDSFVKHQVLVKLVWADDWFVTQPDSFECYTDLYA